MIDENKEFIFKHATEGILIVGSNGDIVKVNPSAQRMFKYEEKELKGKKIEVLIPERFHTNHEQSHSNYMKQPKSRMMGVGIELYGKRKDETEFPVEISLSPFEQKNKKYVIAFIVDISIRKRQEGALKNAYQELQYFAEKVQAANSDLELRVKNRTLILEEALYELEKSKKQLANTLEKEKDLNELKSRFITMASHEFRTPLAAILSSLNLVTKYTELQNHEKQNKHIQRIKTSVKHLTDLLNDILSISKLEEGKISISPENIDIKSFTYNVVKELRPIAKANQKINYKHSGNTNVVLDQKAIKHILFNLISNAIKYSESEINVFTAVENSSFILKVKDSGIGISNEDQKHLFERFFRGSNAANIEGTGLGLNIAAKYVEILNGTIDLESELNEGSLFTVKLPQVIKKLERVKAV